MTKPVETYTWTPSENGEEEIHFTLRSGKTKSDLIIDLDTKNKISVGYKGEDTKIISGTYFDQVEDASWSISEDLVTIFVEVKRFQMIWPVLVRPVDDEGKDFTGMDVHSVYLWGCFLYRQTDFEAALEVFEQVADMGHQDALMDLTASYSQFLPINGGNIFAVPREEPDFEKAFGFAVRGAEIDLGDYTEFHLQAGRIARAQGNLDISIEWYQKAADKGDENGIIGVANCYLQQAHGSESSPEQEELMTKGLNILSTHASQSAKISMHLATIFYGEGFLDKSLAYFESALVLDPKAKNPHGLTLEHIKEKISPTQAPVEIPVPTPTTATPPRASPTTTEPVKKQTTPPKTTKETVKKTTQSKQKQNTTGAGWGSLVLKGLVATTIVGVIAGGSYFLYNSLNQETEQTQEPAPVATLPTVSRELSNMKYKW